jgi:hypothetical protein
MNAVILTTFVPGFRHFGIASCCDTMYAVCMNGQSEAQITSTDKVDGYAPETHFAAACALRDDLVKGGFRQYAGTILTGQVSRTTFAHLIKQ